MNRQLKFTRKMFTLPIVDAGAIYPHISDLPDHDTVGDALELFQLGGYRLRHIEPPWQIQHVGPENGEYNGYKLRFIFMLKNDNGLQEWVKSGFLYDTPGQLDEWMGMRE